MERVIGIGGVFFKAEDSSALRRWYQDNLGIDVDPSYGGAMFGDTAWSVFPSTTRYFDPSTKPYMINYRVRNLDAMLDQLRGAGATVDPKIDDTDYDCFGWAMDPKQVSHIALVIAAVAASSLISVPFGRLILKNEIAAAKKYCESLVPVLDDYRRAHATYPRTLPDPVLAIAHDRRRPAYWARS